MMYKNSVEGDNMNFSIRNAQKKDIEAIRIIFNQGIEDKVSTLESKYQSEADMEKWFFDRDERYKIIVIETEDNHVAGFASLNKFNIKNAYTGVADLSIYIDRNFRGQGVGSMLLEGLFEVAIKEGFYKLVLNVISKNKNALKLYENKDFSFVGVYKKQGKIDGEWVDAIIMEKFLDE